MFLILGRDYPGEEWVSRHTPFLNVGTCAIV